MHRVIMILFVFCSIHSFAQDLTLSGYVKDFSTGEELIGANVSIDGTSFGTTTNVYGFYSITIPKGEYQVATSYLGYKTSVISITLLDQNVKLDIELEEEASVLDEIVVSDVREDANVSDVQMSVAKMEVAQIKKIPSLLGEADIIKAIQLLPGVSTVGEGATGFNVRGGGIDQNLVLLDESPVYNQSHLFGFFSVFNPDAVKNVKLYKGGIPAEFGGRGSSILDIRMKEGNKKEFKGEGGVGIIFSRLTLEAPIKKDKASFVLAGRRSYLDILAKPFLKGDLRDSKFSFYDLTAKVNYRINDKNTLFLSGYFGRDIFDSGFGFDWGNGTGTLRWNSILNDKLFMNMSLIYSNYNYSLGVSNEDGEGFDWQSQIVNTSLKSNYNWYLNNNNTINFGFQGIYYHFKPAQFSFNSGGVSNDISLEDKFGLEGAAFISNEQKISEKLQLQYGLRLSGYRYLGGPTIYEYETVEPGEERELVNSYESERGDKIEDYFNLEPRFAANYKINESSSFKLSYNRMAQYVHLASNTAASSPLDLWIPTTNNIKPQIVDQIALGYFHNFKDNMFETSFEVFYKDMQQQIGYVDNADLFLNENLEADLLQGDGRAYGLELYLKKKKGKFTGWISYTLSKSEVKIEGLSRSEWFLSKFDKPHNFKLVGSYSITPRIELNGTFTFTSGIPATLATHGQSVGGVIVPVVPDGSTNQQRLANYHRLDVSVIIKNKKNNERNWKSEWIFGAYNVYARRNAFNLYYQVNEETNRNEAIRVSILGTVLPSITYNFKF